MIRKLGMVFIMVFITDLTLQTYSAMWLISIALFVHWLSHPFSKRWIDQLEQASLSTIVVTLNAILLIQYHDNSSGSSGTSSSSSSSSATDATTSAIGTKSGLSDAVFYAVIAFILIVNLAFLAMLVAAFLMAIKQKLDFSYVAINKVLKFLRLPQRKETPYLRELLKVFVV